MQKQSSKKVHAILQVEDPDLRFVFAKVKILEELNQKVATYLDANLVPYCQVANLTNNKLVLIVANGSIATQLRFQTNDLLRKFKPDPLLGKIQSIECKVRPPIAQMSPRLQDANVKKMAPISPGTADIIREVADSLEDPKLREIMLRIAGRTR